MYVSVDPVSAAVPNATNEAGHKSKRKSKTPTSWVEKHLVDPSLKSHTSKDIKLRIVFSIYMHFLLSMLSTIYICVLVILNSTVGLSEVFPSGGRLAICLACFLVPSFVGYAILRSYGLGVYLPIFWTYLDVIITFAMASCTEFHFPSYMFILNFPNIFPRNNPPVPVLRFINIMVSSMVVLPGMWSNIKTRWEVDEEKRRLLEVINEVETNAVRVSRLDLESISFDNQMPDRLVKAFNKLTTGLSAFSKYVPVSVVKKLLKQTASPTLGMREQLVTVMFMDIENFTGMCETLSPAQMIEITQDLLASASKRIIETGGTIDKYVGDAIMAFWGAPDLQMDQGFRSCKSAVGLLEELQRLHNDWTNKLLPQLQFRVGINQGRALVGNFGCNERMEYTCIGDVVNVASRLESANKVYGTRVLVSQSVITDVYDEFLLRPLGNIKLKGKEQALAVYELVGIRGGFGDNQDIQQTIENYRNAMNHIYQRQYHEAAQRFRNHLNLFPSDKHTLIMMKKYEDTKNLTNVDPTEFHITLDSK